MPQYPMEQKLIRWIEDHYMQAKHNLSSSGLEEPDFESLGINTSLEAMKRDRIDPKNFFKERLCKLYGFPEENVFLTTGGSESISLLSMVAKARHLPVFIGLPEYEPIFNVPRNMEIDTITAPFENIEGEMAGRPGNKAFFFSNPNNPTGNLHDPEFLNGLRERQFRNGGFMYADEAFLEFTFREKPESFYQNSPDIIINGSMTKFYGFSGLRVGWIVAPTEIVRMLRDLRNVTGIRNPEFPLWAAGQFLDRRDWFMKRAKSILEPNLQYLRSYISGHNGLHWEEPGNGSYGLVRYDYGLSSEEFCRGALEKEKILICPGDFFGAERSFRLCFTEQPQKFRETLDALDSYLKTLH